MLKTPSKQEVSEYLTTVAAAELLGYTMQHTRLLIRQRKLQAKKLGRDWLIEKDELEIYLKLRGPNGK